MFEALWQTIRHLFVPKKKPIKIDPAVWEAEEEVPVLKPMALPPKTKEIPIQIEKRVRNKYQQGWVNKVRLVPITHKVIPITEIVIHGTAGGRTIAGLVNWMLGGERRLNYLRGIGLFHFLIGRERGDIVELLDCNYWVWHSSSGKHDKQTIGIECINPSKSNSGSYTKEQYENLFSLIFDHLIPTYSTITRIVSHRYNCFIYRASNKKQCPGTGFDWKLLDNELRKRGYIFKTDGQCRYDITHKSKMKKV